MFTASLIVGALGPVSSASATSGSVLLHLDGNSGAYTDRSGARAVLGSRQYSGYGRAFNVRMPPLTPPRDARLGTVPYGVFGLTGKDSNGDRDFTDAGDVDPVRLMGAMRSDGVYNLALSSTLGRISNEAENIRILEGARDRNMKLVLRATALTVTSSAVTATSSGTTVTRKSRREGLKEKESLNGPDTLTATGTGDLTTMAGSDVFTMDTTETNQNLQRLKRILTQRPDLEPVIHSWYSLDEPMQRNMSLSELQKIYRAHKAVFPGIPVFICYNQNTSLPDYNGDGLSDGLLGQSENPYGPGVANIVGLNIYIASAPNYNYGAIRHLYAHARRVVNKFSTATPIWAVPQAHGLATRPGIIPRPHHLYRQANDWFRAGPDAGLRGLDGLLWYSWHFEPGSVQNESDLESNQPNRQMAIRIGQRIRSGTMVTHKLPYRSELYVPSAPRATIRVPRSGQLGLAAGTIQLSISRPWLGNDGLRHVLLDTGASVTRNRLLLEKTSGNVLRLVVTDTNGVQKWTGVGVDSYNMPGSGSYSPGYSEIAVTWNNGQLGLYLDGIRGTLGGGTGTGVLSSGGAEILLGTTLEGTYGANSTFGHVTIRSAAMTAADVTSWTMVRHLAHSPPHVVLSSPVNGASLTDRTPTLEWSGAAGANRYQVQMSQNANLTSPIRDVVLASTSYTTSTALVDGKTYYWRVRALDEYGSGLWSSIYRFTIPDMTAPVAIAPIHALAAGSTLGTTAVPVTLSWSATDAASGVAQYQVQQRRYSNGTWGGWGWVTQGTASRTLTRGLNPGTYQFQMRAQDAAGNWSPWKVGATFTLAPYQEGSIASDGTVRYTGSWSTNSLASHYGGSVRHASLKDRAANFTFTGARQVAWVAPRGADRGYAHVYLDGTKVATVNLYSSSTQYRKLVYVKTWSTSGAHTLKVYVPGTKPAASTGTRVDIDAFVVLR